MYNIAIHALAIPPHFDTFFAPHVQMFVQSTRHLQQKFVPLFHRNVEAGTFAGRTSQGGPPATPRSDRETEAAICDWHYDARGPRR